MNLMTHPATSTAHRLIRWSWIAVPPVLLLLVWCVLFGPHFQKQAAIRRLNAAGVAVFYTSTSRPQWVYEWLAKVPGLETYGNPIVAIDVDINPPVRSEDLAQLVPDLRLLRVPLTVTLTASTQLIQDLEALTTLRIHRLTINQREVPAAAIRLLREMPQLDILDLHGCQLDPQAIAEIGELHLVQELSLDQTPITDEGLRPLARLPQLVSLSLTGAEVSDGAKEELCRRLPQLQITDD